MALLTGGAEHEAGLDADDVVLAVSDLGLAGLASAGDDLPLEVVAGAGAA